MENKIIWLTGQPGSGKTVLATKLKNYIEVNYNTNVHHIDGDDLRVLFNNLNYGRAGREENIKRAQDIAKFIYDKGSFVIVSLVSPYKNLRERFKEEIKEDLIEIYVHTTEIRGREHFHLDDYEKPTQNYINIDTTNVDSEVSLNEIVNSIPWYKKNYGGSPTTNESEKYAIFIGRYQPYHYGHINLIKQKLNLGIPVLIMVRDIEPDEKNPFTTDQTISMIEKYHISNGDNVKVIKIPDIESVNFGRGVGYEVNEFIPPNNISNISATKIRESIKVYNDNWKTMVDESIQEDVIKYLTEDYGQ